MLLAPGADPRQPPGPPGSPVFPIKSITPSWASGWSFNGNGVLASDIQLHIDRGADACVERGVRNEQVARKVAANPFFHLGHMHGGGLWLEPADFNQLWHVAGLPWCF
jgi:hypothetical protein